MSAVPDPNYALSATGNLRRREAISKAFVGLTVAAAAAAVLVLFIFIYYAAHKGISVISWHFLTADLPPATGGPGGVGPAIAGTVELVIIATVIAVPIGILTALALAEYAPARLKIPLQIGVELMAGLPTIVIGVFVFIVLVKPFKGESALAGAIGLSIVMVPLIARASLEAINRVPQTMREAADALGVSRWRTITGVVLPTASNGIVTATILAIARAAGETAPLLFACTVVAPGLQISPIHAVPAMSVEILQFTESGYQSLKNDAWGMAFLLMASILLINIGARYWLRRSERKRGQ